jgi:hypothetical protein
MRISTNRMRLLYIAQYVVAQLEKGEPYVVLEHICRADMRTLLENISWLAEGMKLNEDIKQLVVLYHLGGAVEVWPKQVYDNANDATPIRLGLN